MGEQFGNLRAQLVRGDPCENLDLARSWICEKCLVKALELDNPDVLPALEHFMLAILCPKFGD
jgi:hypothetical protein